MSWVEIGGLCLVIGAIFCTLVFLPGMVGSVNESAVPDGLTTTFTGINNISVIFVQILPLFALVMVMIGFVVVFLWIRP